jgi:O-antigen ligase
MRFFEFCEKRKKLINLLVPWLLGLYFILVFLPWYAHPAFLSSFFGSSTIVYLAYRAILVLFFLSISLFVYFANRPKISTNMVFCFLLGMTYVFLVLILGQSSWHYEGTSLIGETVVANVTLGAFEYIKSIASYMFAFVFNFSLFFVLPSALKDKKSILIVFLIVIASGAISVVYSIAAESSYYIDRIKGVQRVDRVAISSLFGSKNSWGKLLFGSFVASFISIKLVDGKWKKAFFILLLVAFGFFTFLSACETALVAEVVVLSVLFFAFLVHGIKTRKKGYVISFVVVSSLFLILAFCFSIDSIRTKIPFSFIYNKISSTSFDSMVSREEIWYSFFQMLSGYRVLFGYGLIGKYMRMFVGLDREDVLSFHNSAINFYCTGGLILLLIAALIFIYGIYQVIKCYKKDNFLSIVLLSVCVGFFIYSFTEEASVVLSSSGDMAFLSFVFASVPSALLKIQSAVSGGVSIKEERNPCLTINV